MNINLSSLNPQALMQMSRIRVFFMQTQFIVSTSINLTDRFQCDLKILKQLFTEVEKL